MGVLPFFIFVAKLLISRCKAKKKEYFYIFLALPEVRMQHWVQRVARF